MAGGVSKHFESTWVYHPGGQRFEDRVGAILSRGHNLQQTFKQEALATAKQAIAFENEQLASSKTAAISAVINQQPAHANSSQGDGNEHSRPAVDARGFVWVTPEGEVIGPASTGSFKDNRPAPSPTDSLTTEKQKAMASMNATQRSMHMWRRINPGCVESTTQFPVSTQKSHYQYKAEHVEPLNKERFRMKTDFTAYADQKIRYA